MRPQAHCAALCWLGPCTPCKACSPLAILRPPGPGTGRQATSCNIPIPSPNPIGGLYSTLQLCSQTDLLCPSPLSPTKPCMAVLCSQPPALHLAPNIPGPSRMRPFPPSWGKENSPTAVLVYKCSSKRFTFSFFSGAGNWLQVFLLGLRAGRALRRERLHRGCQPQHIAPHQLPGQGVTEAASPSHIPVGISLVEDRSWSHHSGHGIPCTIAWR